MRQRTLGILAGAFLIAGAAVGAGTAIYASRSGVTASPAQAGQSGPLHHHRFEAPGQQPGGPGGGPVRQPGAPAL
ncbi:MAG: hypothetical protein ACXWO3_20340 [Isosphaeraceae bacterium]